MKFNRFEKTKQTEINQAVILMRYRTEQPTKKSLKYCTYRTISKTLGISYGTVQHLSRKALLKVK